jgi:hypothetical protein
MEASEVEAVDTQELPWATATLFLNLLHGQEVWISVTAGERDLFSGSGEINFSPSTG